MNQEFLPAYEVIRALQDKLDRNVFSDSIKKLKVLEAGCGSGSNIALPDNRLVVGIDISQEELDKNAIVDEKIVGDLQTYELPEESFDLVVCWDVLEHLDTPQPAIRSMTASVAPGGFLLLAFPNVHSIKGIIAKLTPLWFHAGIYRFIYGKQYGKPGYITFPTYLRWTIAPSKIVKFADTNGLKIVYDSVYESGVQARFRKRIGLAGKMLTFFEGAVRLLSGGKFTLVGSDCIYLLQKQS